MKYLVALVLYIVSCNSHAMDTQLLLLESAESVHTRNAREVEQEFVRFLNNFDKQYPGFISTAHLREVLRNVGQSQLTIEEKKESLLRLQALEKEIKRKRKYDKKEEEENNKILQYYGVVDHGSRKIRRMG